MDEQKEKIQPEQPIHKQSSNQEEKIVRQNQPVQLIEKQKLKFEDLSKEVFGAPQSTVDSQAKFSTPMEFAYPNKGEHDTFKETIGSPLPLIDNSQSQFPNLEDFVQELKGDYNEDDDEKISMGEIQLTIPAQSKMSTSSEKKTFQQKLYLYSIMAIISMSFYLQGAQQGTYNTMTKHLPYIYGWQKNEEDTEGKSKTDLYLGLINSVVTIGAIFVQILMFFFQNTIGRRTYLRIASLTAIIGCCLGLIKSNPILIIGRIINGFSIGVLTTIQAMYIVEYIPYEYKSYMAISGLISFRLGLSVQFGLGYGLPSDRQDSTNSYWRFMVAFPIIVSCFHQGILAFILKFDTPTYIFMNSPNYKEKTLQVLKLIYQDDRAQKELNFLSLTLPHKEKKQIEENKITLLILFKKYKLRLFSGCLIAASFHLGMTNPILMFSNKILEQHHSSSTATLFTTLTPLMDFCSLIPSMYLVKRFGIKNMYCFSATCCVICTYLFSILGYAEVYSVQKFTIWMIRLSFSVGMPNALYSYAMEILPFIGNTITISFLYFCSFMVVQFYLPLSGSMGHEGAFILFGTGLLIVLIILGPCGAMLNTKGLTKAQINDRFAHFKWFNRVSDNNQVLNTI